MQACIVITEEELQQIVQLSQQNNKTNVADNEKLSQGFISWNYSFELLKQMHALHPNVIVKDGNTLAGYALVALKEAKQFHPDLATMIANLETIYYVGKKLTEYNYYVMGQVCVNKDYRGKGVFDMLYQYHKTLFKDKFHFVITEISATNYRSLRAHEKVGFKTIHTYKDAMGVWHVVLWDWQ